MLSIFPASRLLLLTATYSRHLYQLIANIGKLYGKVDDVISQYGHTSVTNLTTLGLAYALILKGTVDTTYVVGISFLDVTTRPERQ